MIFKKLFGSNNDSDREKEDNSLEIRINDAMKKCETDKQEALRDITKLQGWAAEAIMDTYVDFFPNAHLSFYRDKYKTDALQKYDIIKQEHAPKMDKDTVARCDKIVQGYLNHIKMLESKIELFDQLYNEHKQTKQKLESYKHQAAKQDKLDVHSKRLNEMNDDVDSLADAYSGNYELQELQDEVELKEEYFKQMEQLSKQYGEKDSDFENSLAYKEEIDKMKKKLKS